MIDLLITAVEAHREQMLAEGITVELSVPSRDVTKPGIRLDASSERGLAQVVLWETGEADFVVADYSQGVIAVNEHREILSGVGAEDLILSIRGHLSVAGKPEDGPPCRTE